MSIELDRRGFLAMLAAVPFAATAEAQAIPIVDSHIHMFDRTKPGGTFWPPKDDPVPGVSALPARYREMVKPFGIVAAIAVEASPWVEENQWVLDQAAKDTIILGHVGFIDPGLQDFGKNLDRFHRNKLFLGIRYSNRNNRDGGEIAKAVDQADFVTNLKRLADAGLTLDLGLNGVDPGVLLRLTDKLPSLRLVIPHLPAVRLPQDKVALDEYDKKLRQLASRPHVYMKLTEIVRRVDGKPVLDLSGYRDNLDRLWSIFGEDRVIFGSDWPNSEHVGPFADVAGVGRAYVTSKGPVASEKVFWRNSAAAYRWAKRHSSQPAA